MSAGIDIEYHGLTKNITGWARNFGYHQTRLSSKIRCLLRENPGMSYHEAAILIFDEFYVKGAKTESMAGKWRYTGNTFTAGNGTIIKRSRSMVLYDWVKAVDINYNTIITRITNGQKRGETIHVAFNNAVNSSAVELGGNPEKKLTKKQEEKKKKKLVIRDSKINDTQKNGRPVSYKIWCLLKMNEINKEFAKCSTCMDKSICYKEQA